MALSLLPKFTLIAAALVSGVLGQRDQRVCVKVDGSAETRMRTTACCDDDAPVVVEVGVARGSVGRQESGCPNCRSCSSTAQQVTASRTVRTTDEGSHPSPLLASVPFAMPVG